MTQWFQSDFNPYDLLMKHELEITQLKQRVNQLVAAHNQHDTVIVEISDNQVELARLLNNTSNLVYSLTADIDCIKAEKTAKE